MPEIEQEVWVWVIQTKDIPTFYLDPKIQGIRDADHAAEIAGQVTILDIRPEECRLANIGGI